MGDDSRGRIFIVTGPSGVGKTSILDRVRAGMDRVAFSVSFTTRKPRGSERDGENYHFTDERAFMEMVEKDEFLEWAVVHNHRYGTSQAMLEAILERGDDALLDIDVQGALQVMGKLPDALSIFILPPSCEALEERLAGRGDTSPEEMRDRLKVARGEIRFFRSFKYLVVNERLEEAAGAVRSIISAARHDRTRMTGRGEDILNTFPNGEDDR